MKKRILALALCLCFAAALLPAAPARAAVSAADAKTFLKVLEAKKPTNSYLVDFDGDGRDELLTVTLKPYEEYYGDFSYTVTHAQNGTLVSQDTSYSDMGGGTEYHSICSNGGKLYFCQSAGGSDSMESRYYTLQNGSWVLIHTYYGSGGEGFYTLDGKTVSYEEYSKACDAFKTQYYLDPFDFLGYQTSDVTDQLRALTGGGAPQATLAARALLAKLESYGTPLVADYGPDSKNGAYYWIAGFENWSNSQYRPELTLNWFENGKVKGIYLPSTGLLAAKIIDLDHNNVPELAVLRLSDKNEHGNIEPTIYLDLWKYANGGVVPIQTGISTYISILGADAGTFCTFSILRGADQDYIHITTTGWDLFWSTQTDELISINGVTQTLYTDTEDPDWEGGTTVVTYSIDGKNASAAQYNKALNGLSGKGKEEVWFKQNAGNTYNDAFAAYWDDYALSFDPFYLNCGKETQDAFATLRAAAYEGMEPEEILGNVAYAGDPAASRMTAQQANAFAQALEDTYNARFKEWKDDLIERVSDLNRSGYSPVEPISAEAMLFDTGNGNTALSLRLLKCNEVASYFAVYYVWEWVNGQLVHRNDLDGNGWLTFYSGAFQQSSMTGSINAYRYENGRVASQPFFTGSGIEGWTYVDKQGGSTYYAHDNFSWDELPEFQTELYECNYQVETEVHRVISALRAYASNRRYPAYTYTLMDAVQGVYDKILAAAGASEATAVHQLSDGLYYVVYPSGDGFRGALVRQAREAGQSVFRLERTDETPVEQAELEPLVTQALTQSNLKLDYSKLTSRATLDELREYLDGLLQNMDAPTPNDPAKSELAAFLDSAVAVLSSQSVPAKKNHFTPDSDLISGWAAAARGSYDGLSGVLSDNGVELNKAVTPVIRAIWGNVDLEQPCQIDLDRLSARALDGCDLQVLLGGVQTYLRFAADDLIDLTRDHGGLHVQFSQEGDKTYALRFLDDDGEVVDRLEYPITVSLPASSALDTIMASYAGGADNWGGQYDPATGSLSFEARYSGTYEVLENSVDIDDIDGLSEESRAAISFMVSKGYLAAPEGLFRPGDSLTRYEFTEALVGMFFALDRELTCDFPDVDPGSPHYPYVASATSRGIVNGYDNGTFSGEDPINREQAFLLVARTLMDQKGYAQPNDPERYLSSFSDRADISDWAVPQVALAVREGVASRGSVLLPKENITREQAAVVLYRLFQLLYETAPVPLDVPASGGGGGLPLPAVIGIAAGVVALGGGGAAAGVALSKKKKRARQETPSN